MGTSRPLASCLLLLACATAHGREAASPQECQSAAQEPAIATAKAALDEQPDELTPRFKLADAWNDAGCFNEVIQVLQAGLPLHARNGELQVRLRTARSNISEQSYFVNLDNAAEAAKLSRATLRCTKLLEVEACDEALQLKPGDADLLLAKGDTLTQLKRPAEAIVVYRHAASLPHSKDVLSAKLAAAESERQTYLNNCESKSGDTGIQACRAALLPGAVDEFTVLKRQGLLQQTQNQLPAALDTYIAASRLKQDDQAVALAIISLSESTGRKDALTLAARGSALLAVGRPADAVEPLRQAQHLAPGVAEIKTQLAAAQKAAPAATAQRSARVAPLSPTNSTAAVVKRTSPELERLTEAAPVQPASTSREKRYSNSAPATQTN